MSDSPFLNPEPEHVFYEGERVIGLWDAFPVSPGHALLVTRRLVADWFAATASEQKELTEGITHARKAILERHSPDGFNIGINVGAVAGQTIPHLHVHVIPRYRGDVADPTGGVRGVIASKANYLKEAPQKLVEGETRDPLLPLLLSDLDRAVRVDMAVAFILPSGLALLDQHLMDLLEQRRGRLRLLTGDYLEVTDPDALQRLLDFRLPELEGRVELRVFETRAMEASFHPKAYLFTDRQGRSTAYVGSSNLSRSALTEGVEWNYRVIDDPDGLRQAQEAFERLFHHPATVPLTDQWVAAYRRRFRYRPALDREVGAVQEAPAEVPEPHGIQQEALAALQATREAGNQAGLVVLATGLGKTWLSAFDSQGFKRVLFVAHREEILNQARATFRRIRPRASLGLYTGQEKAPDSDVLFASIQTLGKVRHQRLFDPKAFDYVIVDEFHHASAATYRRLIDYFEPLFLLGLTATPERTDGGDLLALCGQNLVYRCDLSRGVELDHLSPFHYYGVPDMVDYANIPWRNSRFDPEALTNAVATRSRAENALDQYGKHGGARTIAFCCSQRHADYMADFFLEQGLRAVAVHSGENSAPRADSLEKLTGGELDLLCCVDMFNEGVDLPNVDTVMMLRPTESRVLWLQQLGRGLRKAEGKDHLRVIDYIGNHRTFLLKVQTLLAELTGASGKASDAEISHALKLLARGEFDLPPGCEVTYELEAVDILKGLLRKPKADERLRFLYQDHLQLRGERPRAVEVYQGGHNPRALKKSFGSWLGFVRMMGGLSDQQEATFAANREFLEHLEGTPMTKSYKMLVVQSMLSQDSFPGEIGLDDLTTGIVRLARRSAHLRRDISEPLDKVAKVRALVRKNPVHFWTTGPGAKWFSFKDDTLSTTGLTAEHGEALQELVREIVEWRLAEYLDRPVQSADGFECKVNHNQTSPILMPLPRNRVPGIPEGWTRVVADGLEYKANFVKVAVNVMREVGGKSNVLPEVLRRWFGADAGLAGTRHRVVFERDGEDWTMRQKPGPG